MQRVTNPNSSTLKVNDATSATFGKAAESDSIDRIVFGIREVTMSSVVYVSKSRIERKVGPLRYAYLPGEPKPVAFSVHGAIAEHYKVPPEKITESHAATIDYVIAGTAG